MSNDIPNPISERAALYVHIPFCKSKCRYCSFYSEPVSTHDTAAVISAIIAELRHYNPAGAVSTIYIGGGSPSCLPERQLLGLISELVVCTGQITEFTIEVNPAQVSEKMLTCLRNAGINRLSIGAQSFNQDELNFLGRAHSVDSVREAVKMGRDAGFDNISLDLIFAVPGSTLDSFQRSLQYAIDLNVEHISAYSLAYEQGTPLQKQLAAGEISAVDEETERQMYELAIDTLASAGFEQYEISNFARKGFQCKHNLTYWANEPYIGIGPGASSYWRGRRTANIADIKRYTDLIRQGGNSVEQCCTLAPIEVACETAVLNLRRICGINLGEFKIKTGFDAMTLFAEPIQRYLKMRLMELSNGRLFLTRNALPIADTILCDFSTI